MRYLRFTLLKNYISKIQKNKRKALLLINTGIFFSIFAVSSAIVSFFIEREISLKQSEILEYQISIKETSSMISNLEMMYNNYDSSINKEIDSITEKQLFSETKLGNKIFSANDFYGPYIEYAEYDLKDFQRAFANDDQFGAVTIVDLFNINHEFNQLMIDAIKETWSEESIEKFTETILQTSKAYNELKKINFENYNNKKIQSFEEISLEILKFEDLHINIESKIRDDYFTILKFEMSLKNWFEQYFKLIKSLYSSDDSYLKSANEEILSLSKKEKNIIFVTFLFQFLVFLIIQIFELNSINFNIKKKLI